MPLKISGNAADELANMARAAVSGDALLVRASAAELRQVNLTELPRPVGLNATELCVAAGLLELLAERMGQSPPVWVFTVPRLDSEFWLVQSARSMPRLQALCKAEGPAVLRRRNLFATPDYLTFA